MGDDTTRRAVIAGTVLVGIGGLSTSSVRDLLEAFAPLSGRVWNAAGRELTECAESPYGEATVRVIECKSFCPVVSLDEVDIGHFGHHQCGGDVEREANRCGDDCCYDRTTEPGKCQDT